MRGYHENESTWNLHIFTLFNFSNKPLGEICTYEISEEVEGKSWKKEQVKHRN